jgi:hypothetical protein
MSATTIKIGFDVITDNTPTLPDARRGAATKAPIRETSEQLEAGLVWWPCGFCGLRVLVDSLKRGRERCQCGAVRCFSKGSEGWRKDGREWWFC